MEPRQQPRSRAMCTSINEAPPVVPNLEHDNENMNHGNARLPNHHFHYHHEYPQQLDEDPLGPHHAQGPILRVHAFQAQSPLRNPITRGMLKRIQMELPQEDQIHHGLPMLFSWTKEDIKI